VLQVLPGAGGTVGEALLNHPLIRKVSFTGSTSVGQRIMELAARDIKRISLELAENLRTSSLRMQIGIVQPKRLL
jgi:betaine-aldehyde dehydrogenase